MDLETKYPNVLFYSIKWFVNLTICLRSFGDPVESLLTLCSMFYDSSLIMPNVWLHSYELTRKIFSTQIIYSSKDRVQMNELSMCESHNENYSHICFYPKSTLR